VRICTCAIALQGSDSEKRRLISAGASCSAVASVSSARHGAGSAALVLWFAPGVGWPGSRRAGQWWPVISVIAGADAAASASNCLKGPTVPRPRGPSADSHQGDLRARSLIQLRVASCVRRVARADVVLQQRQSMPPLLTGIRRLRLIRRAPVTFRGCRLSSTPGSSPSSVLYGPWHRRPA